MSSLVDEHGHGSLIEFDQHTHLHSVSGSVETHFRTHFYVLFKRVRFDISSNGCTITKRTKFKGGLSNAPSAGRKQ